MIQLNPKFYPKFLNFSLDELINTPNKKSQDKIEENYNDEDLKIVQQIKKLIDERVKPAVAQDGGDINFGRNLIMEKVFLILWSCSGCPSSTITLKSGIENMLINYIPEISSVEAINQ